MEKVRPKKALGQNFLTDKNVLSRIVEACGIASGDRVIEVGPGLGSMTRLLAEKGAQVVAVELDRELVPLLEDEFGNGGNVEIIHADILGTNLRELLFSRWEGKWKVAANLPYNISSQVLIRFIDNSELFSRMVLMLQREVGERLIAPPACKEYGILTLYSRLHFDIYREFLVRPGSFYPVPKVDSVVLRFETLQKPRAEVGDEGFFRQVIRGAFCQRRKTLLNSMKSAGIVHSEKVLKDVLSGCGIDGGRRGETLSLDEFASISRALLPYR